MRLAFNIALIFSIFCLPWWVGALVLVAGCFTVRNFYEAVGYGILADALYSTPLGFHGFQYMCTAFALASLLLALSLRSRLAW
jgi:hypothetical protein